MGLSFGNIVTAYWWAYLLAGLVCGIFSATFGVGSGIIMVPTLVVIFSLPQKSAQGTCLAAMTFIALAGAIRYGLSAQVKIDLLAVGLLVAGGVVGAMIGSSIASALPAATLRKLFAVVMIVVAVKMLITPSRGGKKQQPPEPTTATEKTTADP